MVLNFQKKLPGEFFQTAITSEVLLLWMNSFLDCNLTATSTVDQSVVRLILLVSNSPLPFY